MANLYGRLRSERGKEVTKTGHSYISATLETGEAAVTLTMRADGAYTVELAEKYAPSATDEHYRANAHDQLAEDRR